MMLNGEKKTQNCKKVIFLWFSERCHGNMCNLNVIVVLEFISRDLYLLFAICFSSKFQNSVFIKIWGRNQALNSLGLYYMNPVNVSVLKTDVKVA